MGNAIDIGFGRGPPTLQCSRGLFSLMGAPSSMVAVSGGGPTPGAIKFNPGHYIQSGSINGTGSQNQAEMNAIAAHTPQTVQGYAPLYTFDNFENATLGTYDWSDIATDFNYWQSVMPGKRFGIGVACYKNSTSVTPGNIASYNAHSHGTPLYILNDPGTYGSGPVGSSGQGGYGLSNYNGTNYGYQNMALWNQNTMNRFIAFWTALAAAPLGAYTVDTHPQVEYVFDYGPTDLNMIYNGSNAPNLPTDYSSSAWQAQWLRRFGPMSAAFPHTSVGLMPGFGANGPGGSQPPSDQGILLASMNTNRIALASTDVFAVGATQLTYAQNQFIGNSYSGNTLIAGGGTDYRGRLPSMPTVQGYDYTQRLKSGSGVNTIQTVKDIANVAVTMLNATHIWWQAISQVSAGVPGNLNSFILPGIDQSVQTVQTQPSNYS